MGYLCIRWWREEMKQQLTSMVLSSFTGVVPTRGLFENSPPTSRQVLCSTSVLHSEHISKTLPIGKIKQQPCLTTSCWMHQAGACWGYYQFFRMDLLEKEGYLTVEEDTITLRFYVRPLTYATPPSQFPKTTLSLNHQGLSTPI